MRVLITGGAGFIGSSLCERLLRTGGYQITVFDNFSGPDTLCGELFEDDRVEVVTGDVRNLSALNQCMKDQDIVFHFASNASIAAGFEDTKLDLDLGIVATYNVLESMRKQGVKKIVFASGSGVYGNRGRQPAVETQGEMLPVSLYGASKLAAESLISAFANLYGITAYILRPANIVGLRQTHGVVFDFVRKLSADPGHLLILGDGKQTKSYLYIDDFLEALFCVLAKSEGAISIYNVASDDLVDVNWIARKVIAEMQLSNVNITYTGGVGGWPGDVPYIKMDTSRLKNLGWKADLNSQEAVERTIQELLAAKKLERAV